MAVNGQCICIPPFCTKKATVPKEIYLQTEHILKKRTLFGVHTAGNGWIIEPWLPYSKLFAVKNTTSKCIYFPEIILVFFFER
jgi:hypothetical protein